MGRMKTTIELPDELLIEAKRKAASERRPLRALFEEGLRLALKKPGRSPRKRAVRLVTVKGGLPRELDLSDRESMYEWVNRQK
jgi:hypothetical protein